MVGSCCKVQISLLRHGDVHEPQFSSDNNKQTNKREKQREKERRKKAMMKVVEV